MKAYERRIKKLFNKKIRLHDLYRARTSLMMIFTCGDIKIRTQYLKMAKKILNSRNEIIQKIQAHYDIALQGKVPSKALTQKIEKYIGSPFLSIAQAHKVLIALARYTFPYNFYVRYNDYLTIITNAANEKFNALEELTNDEDENIFRQTLALRDRPQTSI